MREGINKREGVVGAYRIFTSRDEEWRRWVRSYIGGSWKRSVFNTIRFLHTYTKVIEK